MALVPAPKPGMANGAATAVIRAARICAARSDQSHQREEPPDRVASPSVDPLLSGKDPKLQVQNNFRATPLMIGGVLYSKRSRIGGGVPGTGKTIWIQEPAGSEGLRGTSTRGVAHWRDGSDERIFVQRGESLIALNAKTGQPYSTFGANGVVNLRLGSSNEPSSWSGAPRVQRRSSSSAPR